MYSIIIHFVISSILLGTCFKIGNRIGAVVRKDDKDAVDSDIVVGLLEMLGDCNRLVKDFKMARVDLVNL